MGKKRRRAKPQPNHPPNRDSDSDNSDSDLDQSDNDQLHQDIDDDDINNDPDDVPDNLIQQHAKRHTKVLGKLSYNIDLLSDHKLASRISAFTDLISLLQSYPEEEFSFKNRVVLYSHIEKALKKGKSEERNLATMFLPILMLNYGVRSIESDFENFFPIFSPVLSNIKVHKKMSKAGAFTIEAQARLLLCLGIIGFLTATDKIQPVVALYLSIIQSHLQTSKNSLPQIQTYTSVDPQSDTPDEEEDDDNDNDDEIEPFHHNTPHVQNKMRRKGGGIAKSGRRVYRPALKNRRRDKWDRERYKANNLITPLAPHALVVSNALYGLNFFLSMVNPHLLLKIVGPLILPTIPYLLNDSEYAIRRSAGCVFATFFESAMKIAKSRFDSNAEKVLSECLVDVPDPSPTSDVVDGQNGAHAVNASNGTDEMNGTAAPNGSNGTTENDATMNTSNTLDTSNASDTSNTSNESIPIPSTSSEPVLQKTLQVVTLTKDVKFVPVDSVALESVETAAIGNSTKTTTQVTKTQKIKKTGSNHNSPDIVQTKSSLFSSKNTHTYIKHTLHAIYQLSTGSFRRSLKRKDRVAQKKIFKTLFSYVADGIIPQETIQILSPNGETPGKLIVQLNGFILSNRVEILREILSQGFICHLQSNPTVATILDFQLPGTWSASQYP